VCIIDDMGVVLEDDEVIGIQAVICPECVKIINTHDELEIEWFDTEDAKYFGYKVVIDDGTDGTE
jgi:hypothetical protein